MFDVFDADGYFLGTVSVPENASVRYMQNDTVWGVVRDSLDIEYVMRWRLNGLRPSAGPVSRSLAPSGQSPPWAGAAGRTVTIGPSSPARPTADTATSSAARPRPSASTK